MKKNRLNKVDSLKITPDRFLRGEAKRMFAALSLVQKGLTSKNELYRSLKKAWKSGDNFDLDTLENEITSETNSPVHERVQATL